MSANTGFGPTGVSSVKGTGYKQISMPTKSNDQMELFRTLLGGAQGGLGGGGLSQLSNLASGGDEAMWSQLEAPAMRQFGQLQGDIASRFSGMGSGARRSSGFQNSMNSAAVDLSERLQSQRMGLQQSAIQQLLGLSQSLLGTDLQENMFMPKKKPFWQELLGGMSPGIGQGVGTVGGMWLGKKAGLLG